MSTVFVDELPSGRNSFSCKRRSSLPWRGKRQVSDFVEEQRTAIRRFHESLPVSDGAGERAAEVSEEFTLSERFVKRRALDCDERRIPPAAALVQKASDEFLACPRLPFDENPR